MNPKSLRPKILRSASLAALLAVMAITLPAAKSLAQDESLPDLRRSMVDEIRTRGVADSRVLDAMVAVPRHDFVPASQRPKAYEDSTLSLGHGQTVYQPYIVALMTELLDLGPSDKVLEIGTGSGYHTAVLSRVAGRVYSMEIIEQFARDARRRLDRLGYNNVEVRAGDGYQGWPEAAPFDAIILTAAPPELPQSLVDQLRVGGKMVAPVGEFFQDLRVIKKTRDGIETESVIPVRLQPMERQENRSLVPP
ncbi:MAG: protein-L-isoaspartate(D-aspartate) O-methyltransferase [Acidobacteriota bacterium]